ncbi:MAG: DNA polymerase I [Porphyromonas sp.]|nr:DNA polymerase I [Porphyromonas sp.]
MSSPKQLYLIDAYALIYRAYFPFDRRPRLDSQGRNTSAIYGFVNVLNDILNSFRPEHLAVVFDPPGGSFRNEFYPAYKANRQETPEAIKFGVPYIKDFLQAMHIPVIEVPGYEADDVIGTLSVQAEAAGYEVLMVTPDKDYGQLVTPNVSILAPITGGGYEELGVSDVCTKFGVSEPRLVIDALGIIGDSADNFPGIRGVGPAGATKLLSEYGSLEEILAHADEIKGKLGENVRAGREDALVSKRLATIALDVPVELSPDAYARQQPDMARVSAILSELELRQQLKRMTELYKTEPSSDLFDRGFDGEGADNDQDEDAPGEDEGEDTATFGGGKLDYKAQDLLEDEVAQRFVAELATAQTCYIYALTHGEQSIAQSFLGLGFTLDASPDAYHLVMQESVFVQPRPVLERLFAALPEGIKLVGHDLKALYLTARHYGLRLPKTMEDIMIAHYLLMPDMSHHLPGLSARYLKHELMSWEELIAPQKPNKFDPELLDPERLGDYLASRAVASRGLHQLFVPELEKRQQYQLLLDLEMPLLPILAEMERTGVRIDKAELARQAEIMEQELNDLEQDIHTLAGHEFNVNSTRQVGEVLFEELALDAKAKKTKTGIYTTSEEVLEKYRSKHPIVDKILEYRGYRKLLSTYITALPELCDEEGRVHTSFNQTVAATGRLSSTNPNIQNIPIRTERGRAIRAAFVPSAGEVFLSADYSQIELRLMAHFSQDPGLIEAFRLGLDVHQATAARIAGVGLDEVDANMRRNAKTANFGIIYGVSAFGLAEQLGISRTEAKQLIEGYFASYPGVATYMQQVVANARAKGYVETIAGRRRYLSDIDSANAVVRGYAERNAINAPLQGTAADIIKLAMIAIDRELSARGLGAKMLLQVHDELNFSVPPAELDEVIELVKRCMIEVGKDLRVPLEVGIGTGQNWLEAH